MKNYFDLKFKGHDFVYIGDVIDGAFSFVCKKCKSEILISNEYYWFWPINNIITSHQGKFNIDIYNEMSCDEALIKEIIE